MSLCVLGGKDDGERKASGQERSRFSELVLQSLTKRKNDSDI